MIPIQRQCDVENLGDFSRYYGGSWVGWHGSDAAHIRPCYVGHLLDAERIQLRPLTKTSEGKFVVEDGFVVPWTDLKNRLDFGTPDIGMTPDGPTVIFCSYTSPRVARKGYKARDMKQADFNSWDIRKKYNNRNNGDRYDWTWFSFNPEYRSLAVAEDKLAKGESVGEPLSRTLAVYSLPKFRNSLLAYKRWTVGHVLNPYLISLKREYADYEEDIARQTGSEVIVG